MVWMRGVFVVVDPGKSRFLDFARGSVRDVGKGDF